MKIAVSRFGKILISRPHGREAYLAARAYVLPDARGYTVELDFSGVEVLTPSWADEFVRGLRQEIGENKVRICAGGNASVQLALKAIADNPEI